MPLPSLFWDVLKRLTAASDEAGGWNASDAVPLTLSREASLLNDAATFPVADAFLVDMPLPPTAVAHTVCQPLSEGAPLAGSAALYNAVQVLTCTRPRNLHEHLLASRITCSYCLPRCRY